MVYDEDVSTTDAAKQLDIRYATARAIIAGRMWRSIHRRIAGNRRPPTHFRSPKGEQHGNKKLTQAQVDEIRARAAAGEHKRELGWEFKVSQRTIYRIVTGESWSTEDEQEGK